MVAQDIVNWLPPECERVPFEVRVNGEVHGEWRSCKGPGGEQPEFLREMRLREAPACGQPGDRGLAAARVRECSCGGGGRDQ